MKFSILLFLIFFSCSVFGQRGDENRWLNNRSKEVLNSRGVVIQEPQGFDEAFDIATRKLFTVYPNLDSIHFQFEKRQPSFIMLFFEQDILVVDELTQKSSEFFDLRFEGDKYLLQRKYEPIFSFVSDSSIIRKLQRLNDSDDFNTALYDGSLSFRRIYTPAFLYATAPKSTREKLRAELESKYEDRYSPRGDSVLIVQAVVERNKTLGNFELMVGEPSPLYDLLASCLLASGNIWLPFLDGSGSPRRGLIDIFVRLTPEKKIIFSTSGRSRKQLIKDVGEGPSVIR